MPPALSKPTIHGTVVPPIVGVLYTLKYMLIYRIASIKNMLPYSDFVDVLYPPELSRMTNSNEKGYVAHFIHLSCILHSCFSM
uniref:Uncharacterized protein n=1 Tax=Ditylenchus dipsaci TaxID=166011 RepID=A0A915D9P4_9BILA